MTLEFRSASRFTRNVFDACLINGTAKEKGEEMDKFDEILKALQSIDKTLKRIEVDISDRLKPLNIQIDGKSIAHQENHG